IEGGIFFFTVALLDRSSELLVQHVERLRASLSCGSGAPAVRNQRHLHFARPSPCHLDPASRRCRFRVALGPNQERIFPWTGSSSTEIEEPTTKARNRNLAAPLLGA